MSSFLCSYHIATLPKTTWSNFTKVSKYNLLTATKAQVCSDKKCNIHLKDGHHKEVLEWAVSRNGSERWLLGLLPWLLARLSPLSYQVVVNFFWPQGSKPSRIWRGMFTFLLPLYWNVYFITLAIALGGNQFMDLLELEANTFPLVHILANLCPFLEFSCVFVRMVVDFGGPLMPPSWSLLQVDNFSRNWS
jgi:hypothetical protein